MFLYTLLLLLILSPAGELLLFFFVKYAFMRLGFSTTRISIYLLAASFGLYGVGKMLILGHFGKGLFPLMIAMYVLIVAVLAVLAHLSFRHQLVSAIVTSVLLFIGMQWLFTNVKVIREYPVKWKAGDIAAKGSGLPNEHRIEFIYSAYPNHHEVMYSDEILNQLQKNNTAEATIRVRQVYDWGAFKGHSIVAINGIQIPPTAWSSGGYRNSYEPSPFHRYYLGSSH